MATVAQRVNIDTYARQAIIDTVRECVLLPYTEEDENRTIDSEYDVLCATSQQAGVQECYARRKDLVALIGYGKRQGFMRTAPSVFRADMPEGYAFTVYAGEKALTSAPQVSPVPVNAREIRRVHLREGVQLGNLGADRVFTMEEVIAIAKKLGASANIGEFFSASTREAYYSIDDFRPAVYVRKYTGGIEKTILYRPITEVAYWTESDLPVIVEGVLMASMFGWQTSAPFQRMKGHSEKAKFIGASWRSYIGIRRDQGVEIKRLPEEFVSESSGLIQDVVNSLVKKVEKDQKKDAQAIDNPE